MLTYNWRILRHPSTDQGTFGELAIGQNTWITGELPWHNNESNKSCIPTGTYRAKIARTDSSNIIQIIVPDRESIRITNGNFCGDIDKGFVSDTNGSILVGKTKGLINEQQAVLYSKMALAEITEIIGDRTIEITIACQKPDLKFTSPL